MSGFRPRFRSAVRSHKNIAYKAGKSAFPASIMSPKPSFVKSRLSISIHFGKEWIKMASSGITQQRAGAPRLQLSALVLVNAFVQDSVQRHNAQGHSDDQHHDGHTPVNGDTPDLASLR